MSTVVVTFRAAAAGDADRVAALHAESWRRHYRGAYADAFLDGDVFADRRAVWSARLADPAPQDVTVLAEVPGQAAPPGKAEVPGSAALPGEAEVPGAGAGISGGTAGPGRELAGFVHLVLDHDPGWGALVDNLHVARTHHRHGIGAELMRRAARAVRDRGATDAMYLWVLERNTAARAFYSALGGRFAQRSYVPPPGGVPGRLDGRPVGLRCVWPDVGVLLSPPR
ncbi:GNAT family N-acetyltransferase [Plantactinospora sp. WMMB782]|uniref:GNAT family N-acetyltransferase n=1 Tax=Plantactinospora sp. WMMB782 TaxID=3404121 RepID=UPI003B940DB2